MQYSVDEASSKCRHSWMRRALHDWLRRQGWTELADKLDRQYSESESSNAQNFADELVKA
jgi:hypothetical protein